MARQTGETRLRKFPNLLIAPVVSPRVERAVRDSMRHMTGIGYNHYLQSAVFDPLNVVDTDFSVRGT